MQRNEKYGGRRVMRKKHMNHDPLQSREIGENSNKKRKIMTNI